MVNDPLNVDQPQTEQFHEIELLLPEGGVERLFAGSPRPLTADGLTYNEEGGGDKYL